MKAIDILAYIEQKGMVISTDSAGEKLLVSPANSVTGKLGAAIKENKSAILSLLKFRQHAQNCLFDGSDNVVRADKTLTALWKDAEEKCGETLTVDGKRRKPPAKPTWTDYGNEESDE